MVRVKPAGVSLSVWRLKHSTQSKNVVIITIRCGGSAPWSVLHTPAMDYDDAFSDGSVATCDVNTTRRARRSWRSRCSGALRDFQKEERCTARGRRYHVYLSPSGMQFVSKVAALRAVQPSVPCRATGSIRAATRASEYISVDLEPIML